jgi:hypothetical protein
VDRFALLDECKHLPLALPVSADRCTDRLEGDRNAVQVVGCLDQIARRLGFLRGRGNLFAISKRKGGSRGCRHSTEATIEFDQQAVIAAALPVRELVTTKLIRIEKTDLAHRHHLDIPEPRRTPRTLRGGPPSVASLPRDTPARMLARPPDDALSRWLVGRLRL